MKKPVNKQSSFVGRICFLILILLFPFGSFSQDTIPARPFPFDTTLIENSHVDTVTAKNSAAEQEINIQKPFHSKFYYGGFVNVTFGSYTVVGVEPSFAYKFTPRLSLGTKLSYEYIHEKQGSYVYEESNYGFSLFSRMRILPRIYTHAEFSSMNFKFYDELGNSERKWVPFLFLGGGMSQPVSENVWLNAEILFDVLQNENSPYKDWEPFYSVGFGVGF
jgi:hypothetical protein